MQSLETSLVFFIIPFPILISISFLQTSHYFLFLSFFSLFQTTKTIVNPFSLFLSILFILLFTLFLKVDILFSVILVVFSCNILLFSFLQIIDEDSSNHHFSRIVFYFKHGLLFDDIDVQL
eukprot:UN10924